MLQAHLAEETADQDAVRRINEDPNTSARTAAAILDDLSDRRS